MQRIIKLPGTLLVMLIICVPVYAQDYLKIRVSFKIIVSPYIGTNPPGINAPAIESEMAEVNRLLQSTKSGMLFDLVEVETVGGVQDSVSIKFYDVSVGVRRGELEIAAEQDPVKYKWREDCINVYINGATLGRPGACSFPTFTQDEVVFLSSEGLVATTILHEIGHFFHLIHTHQGQSPDSCDGYTGGGLPGSADLIDDTLDDFSCWDSIDSMSMYHFSQAFNDISDPASQKLLLESYHNIMSYHQDEQYLTADQMKRWHDKIWVHTSRQDVVTGFPRYVDKASPCTLGCSCSGRPYDAYADMDCAIDATVSSQDDVIIVAPGTYDLTTKTINSPLLMISTKEGGVLLR